MMTPQQALNRLRAFFGKRNSQDELDTEMAAHLELAIDENLRLGMTPGEARRRAFIRFGGLEQAKERYRENSGLPALDTVLQDLRYSWRTLLRDRGFTLAAVLILALGIGANVTVFNVVNSILLRPLPFHDPRRLTWLSTNEGKGDLSNLTYTVAAFEEFQRHNKSFEQVTSFQTFFNSIDYKLTGYGQPKPVFGVEVAGNFFQTLGVEPIEGRLFTPEECRKGGRAAAVLSYPFWQRQFAGNPSIVGQPITLNKQAFTVVGVLPNTFDFGSVFAPGLKVDFFVPAVMDFWRTWGNTLALVGRLKPGVTVAQANAESKVLFPQLRAAHPDWYEDYQSKITELQDYVSGKLRRSLIVLWCAVLLILLIVCVNLATLVLARASARGKEFAMRTALGARRSRIVRQLLTESLVLSAAGALLGLCFAVALTAYLAHQGSIALPLLSSVRVDGNAVAWTVLLAFSAALLFGLFPAFQTSSVRLQDTLKDSGPGMTHGTQHQAVRTALVTSEIALALVLLIGAGLLLRSFLQVLDIDLGFRPENAAAIKIDYNDGNSPARRAAIMQNILRHVSSVPGIAAAGIVDMLPLDRNRSWGFQAKGRLYRPGDPQVALVYVISPGYLDAMGMHLRSGRDFTWHDGADSEPVVIINEGAARLHWPGQDPVGRFALINGRDTRVAGVISDVRALSVEDAPNPEMYLPVSQAGPEGADLVVRTRLRPEALQTAVMTTLRELNPGQPSTEFRPVQQIVDHAVSPRRFFVLLVTVFAALALVLASIGIYGVISYSVTQQTQEIGIRMALGATAANVQIAVMQKTLRFTLIGLAAGTAAALGVAKFIASLLFGIAPTDRFTFLGMALLLGSVALLAGYFPARRASRIDPMKALRSN